MLSFTAPLNDRSYGYASFHILKELLKQGKSVCYWSIPSDEYIQVEADYIPLIQRAIDRRSTCDEWSPSVRIWHAHQLNPHNTKGPKYGWPIFELDRFTPREVEEINSQDYLIVSSEWGKGIMEAHTRRPVKVVPLGVDTDIFSPAKASQDEVYTFINIGKIEFRKGHDILVEAFNLAFNDSDKVRLRLMWSNPFLQPYEVKEWENFYKNSFLGDKIEFIPWRATQAEVAQEISNADCGLFPSRAEGWNLGLLECMAMNKPVITTNYSAHTEYCNSANSFLIEPKSGLEPADDGKWFHGHGNWMKMDSPEIRQLADYMRFVYDNNIRENPEGVKTAQAFSWANSATKLWEAMH